MLSLAPGLHSTGAALSTTSCSSLHHASWCPTTGSNSSARRQHATSRTSHTTGLPAAYTHASPSTSPLAYSAAPPRPAAQLLHDDGADLHGAQHNGSARPTLADLHLATPSADSAADAAAASDTPAPAAGAALGMDRGNAAGDRQLYEEIKSCTTWQDVLDLVEDEAGSMSMFSAVQAASRLVALLRPLGVLGKTEALAAMAQQPAFRTLRGVLLEGVPTMSRAQLANSLQAMGQLRMPLGLAATQAYADRAALLAPELNARDITALLQGFTSLGKTPGLPVLNMLGFRATHLLADGTFEPQGVTMLLSACAELQYCNKQLLRAAAQVLQTSMPGFTTQGVAQSVRSLAKLRSLPQAVLELALARYEADPAAFRPQESCALLWALAQTRFSAPDALSAMVRSLAGQARSLAPADFATLFYTLGVFGIHPGAANLAPLSAALQRSLPRCSAVELCNVYWGLGLMGEGSGALAASIAAMLPDLYQANQMPDSLLRQAFQGFLSAKLSAAEAAEAAAISGSKADAKAAADQPGADVRFPPMMMEAMKRAWADSMQAAAARKLESDTAATSSAQDASSAHSTDATVAHASSSNGVRDGADEDEDDSRGREAGDRASAQSRAATNPKELMARILTKLRVPYEQGCRSQDGLVGIDLALHPSEDRFIALQVVMQSEHTSNTGQLLGPAQFQASVLQMNGWEVRHIRAKDVMALPPVSKLLFVGDILRSMGCRIAAADTADTAGLDKQASLAAGGMRDEDAQAPQRAAGRGRQDSSARGSGERGLDLLMAEDMGSGSGAQRQRRAPARRAASAQ